MTPRVEFLASARWFFVSQSRETMRAIAQVIERAARSRRQREARRVRGTARLFRVIVAGCRVLYLRSERRLIIVSIAHKPSNRALERLFPVASAPHEEGPTE